jgi:hypothetical protein
MEQPLEELSPVARLCLTLAPVDLDLDWLWGFEIPHVITQIP